MNMQNQNLRSKNMKPTTTTNNEGHMQTNFTDFRPRWRSEELYTIV